MEKVGNVQLNYEYYSGTDDYSDGAIELELLDYVKSDKSIMEILKNDNRWPILYHLSPVRKNILEWYPFDKNEEALEIGSGCGAVTGALCEKLKSVTCIELSKTRSLINANRNKEYDNLEIMVGNFNDIKIEKKYKYITLIGVLEYSAYYTDTKNPFVDFLKRIKNYLKPDGKLLIAIENKYGLKYFAGACEDHTGRMYDGIEGYINSDAKVRTFSKNELENIIKEAGYDDVNFYYPFPDYKLPTQIYSPEFLPDGKDLVCSLDCYDNNRVRVFDETVAFENIIDAGMFEFFSNSYFIEVGQKENKEFSKFTKERKEEFQIETGIYHSDNERYVVKRGLNEKSKPHVMKMFDIYEEYNSKGITNLNKCEKYGDEGLRFEFLKGESLNNSLVNAVMKRDKSLCKKLINEYKNVVNNITDKLGTEEFDNNEQFTSVFGDAKELVGTEACKDIVFDLIFENLIDNKGQYSVIDYEWCFDFAVPVEFIMFRAMWGFYSTHGRLMDGFMTLEEIMDIAGIQEDRAEIYKRLNNNFIEYVYGKESYQSILSAYKKINADILNSSIKDSILNYAYMKLGYTENENFKYEKKILENIISVMNEHSELYDDANKFFKTTEKLAKQGAKQNKLFLGSEIFCTELTNCLEDLNNTITYYKEMASKKDKIFTELISKKNDIDEENKRLQDELEKVHQELDYIKSTKVYRYGLKNKVDKYKEQSGN